MRKKLKEEEKEELLLCFKNGGGTQTVFTCHVHIRGPPQQTQSQKETLNQP